ALDWGHPVRGEVGDPRVDPATPQTVYHTYRYPGTPFLERSDDGGRPWQIAPPGINRADPARFYPPYVIDAARPNRLLLGTNRVYESVNRAGTWLPRSQPMTAGWTVNNDIDSVAAAASDVNTIYASAGGRIFVTTNRSTT